MLEKLKNFSYMKYRKRYYIFCIVLIIASIAVGGLRGFNMGIDFTGGTVIHIDMEKEVPVQELQGILSSQKLSGDIVHAGETNEQIIIKTGESLNTEKRDVLINALMEKYSITKENVLSVENIGPSVGDSLKSNAAKATGLAIVLMLLYIAIRFQWKYGVAAILALINTVLIVIGFYGIFQIPINSPFIAAILTVLGYGINDTIVIFDRIRENVKTSRSRTIPESMVNNSISQTLGRSIMTSFTTVCVMIPLLIICGDTIRSFILPMMIGIIASTLSSIFIATSIWFDNNKSTEIKKSKYAKSVKAAKS